jgi:hypothetical protein
MCRLCTTEETWKMITEDKNREIVVANFMDISLKKAKKKKKIKKLPPAHMRSGCHPN